MQATNLAETLQSLDLNKGPATNVQVNFQGGGFASTQQGVVPAC